MKDISNTKNGVQNFEKVGSFQDAIADLRKFSDNIESQIQSLVNIGDYSGAYNTAIDLAGKAVSDVEGINRIRFSNEFNAYKKVWEDKYNSGKIDGSHLNYALHINDPKYENIYKKDESGKDTDVIVGYKQYRPVVNVPDAPDYPGLTHLAFKSVTPRTSSYSSDGTVDGKIKTTSINGKEHYIIQDVKTGTTFSVLAKEIHENFYDIYKNATGVMEQVDFDYKSKLFDLENKRKRLTAMEEAGNTDSDEYKSLQVSTADLESVFVFDKWIDGERITAENGRTAFFYNKMYSALAENLAKTNTTYDASTRVGGGSGSESSNNTSNGGWDVTNNVVEGSNTETK